MPRINPPWGSDPEIFSRYDWLVVETHLFEPEPFERSLSKPMNSDWAEIEPHRPRVSSVVEAALFARLLAPWEDWVDNDPGLWRPFEVPWERKVGNDPSVWRQPLPSAGTLAWDLSPEGGFVMPGQALLKDGVAADISRWVNESRWANLARAERSPFFETPVKHFFVKAFLEKEPLDEFLAHLTTIEAALLLENERRGLTKLVRRRVSTLLGARCAGKDYEYLYNLRCAFLHGRKMDRPIPGEARLMARQLARKVVHKLAEAALAVSPPASREAYLKRLAP